MKFCIKCKQYKELNYFSKNKGKKDGLRIYCRPCSSILQKVQNKKRKEKDLLYQKRYYLEHKEEKSAKSRVYWNKKENRKRRNAHRKMLRRNKLDWGSKHKERIREIKSNHKKRNKGRINADTAKRNAAKLQRTPPWLTKQQLKEIREFYTLAQELQWLSQEPLHVDHIVPLQGEDTSGLHVPWNLQILSRSMNCAKGNKVA